MHREQTSARREWTSTELLVASFCISLAFHLLVWGMVRVSPWFATQLAKVFPQSARLKETTDQKLSPTEKLNQLLAARRAEEKKQPPLMFIQVNPETATTEPPPNPKYYSAQSSVAANPDASRDTERPQIDGKQEVVRNLMDIPKTGPSAPSTKPVTKEREEPKPVPPVPATETREPIQPKELAPKPRPTPGDLAMARPAPKTENQKGKEENAKGKEDETVRERPKTLAEARARLGEGGGIAGEKMKQQGGVKRLAFLPSEDTQGTPLGAYDQEMFAAIQQRWYDTLEEVRYMHDRRGFVALKFRIHSDGRVSGMEIVETDLEGLLVYYCQKAIQDPSPYAKWPTDMRLLVERDYRDITVKFFYR